MNYSEKPQFISVSTPHLTFCNSENSNLYWCLIFRLMNLVLRPITLVSSTEHQVTTANLRHAAISKEHSEYLSEWVTGLEMCSLVSKILASSHLKCDLITLKLKNLKNSLSLRVINASHSCNCGFNNSSCKENTVLNIKAPREPQPSHEGWNIVTSPKVRSLESQEYQPYTLHVAQLQTSEIQVSQKFIKPAGGNLTGLLFFFWLVGFFRLWYL